MSAVDLLERLEAVRVTGPNRWIARCPAHDDRSPSLSVRDTGERLLLHCFAGCDACDVVRAVGLELADLFPTATPTADDEHRKRPPRRRILAADILAALDHEAHVVAVIAADIAERREIDIATWSRLSVAVQRIGAARDLH